MRCAKLIFVVSALVAFAIGRSPATAQEVVLKYAGTLPLSHHLGEAQGMYADKVKQKTNGKVKIEVYPAGQLFGARQIPTAIASGAADLGFNLTGVWSTDPVSELSDVPFLYRDAGHAAKAWARGDKLYKAYEDAMVQKNLKVVHVMFFGSLFDFGNNVRLLKGPGDFKGMKIRGYGKLSAEALRALGASPVVMSPGEMYLALQRGTVDGAITGVTSLESRKIWEVTKFATITHATFGVFAVNTSTAKWNSLSKDVQQALTEAGDELFKWSVDESVKRDRASLQFLKDKGLTVHELTAEDQKVWAKAFEPAVKAWNTRANDAEKALLNWVVALR
jgi:TRAP-type C4-dicarboxylate transport system substrate-binding protein